ncbi:hypothetical protein GPECTOR_45g143 [Gonium pectorale]|uniref:Fumarylacetoacetase n=1 Tax=Gonium pectorale TaxID=33097 RepID=A0A150G929_GONPE|nr:hypothetical protein GPECTOR_45g143 [Gonium pectorale]|eukprot:KXZ46273.1 hypothetical protein GPECTOR_45g143 [Gonium pectorale]
MDSFIEVPPDSDFPLENLPWGVFEADGPNGPTTHVGVALGDHAISVTALQAAGYLADLPGAPPGVFSHGRLNEFMGAGRPAWVAARQQLQRLLGAGEGALRDDESLRRRAIFKQADVVMRLPCAVGDYTDFYTSRQHATNAGAMFRGLENALHPNWLHLPVGYHGRASSIVPSGVDVRRPWGQVMPPSGGSPAFAPSGQVDFELEVAAVIGPGNPLGEPIPVSRAWERVFGLVLLNDWSARDIQKWEYVPLGPFNGKNWVTQISPWVVTLEALEAAGARCAPPPQTDPAVLPYLRDDAPYTYDVDLAVDVTPAGSAVATTLTRSNLRHLYWTFPQMIAHHTAGGCNLRPGDLIGSGTISGDEPGSRGCLLELTWAGRDELELRYEPDLAAGGAAPLAAAAGLGSHGAAGVEGKGAGEGAAGGRRDGVVMRKYLQDGDRVTLRGWCGRRGGAGGAPRWVGFGACSGALLPSLGR